MLTKLKEKMFPCEKIISTLVGMHDEAVNAATNAAQRLTDACDNMNGKLCIITPYNGHDRRKDGK